MKGTPRPFIYWVLNGRFVTYDSIRKIFNGTRLNIAREEIHFSRIDFRPLRRFDGGEYTCFGSNYGGVIERKYSLDVDCKYYPLISFAVFTSVVRSLQGWVHTALVTNLSIFVSRSHCSVFVQKSRQKYPFLWVCIAHSDGGRNIHFCVFNPFSILWSRQISVFVRSHLSTAVKKYPFLYLSTFIDIL